MKYLIRKNDEKREKEETALKKLGDLLLFAFSMSVITILLIFGTIEGEIEDKNEENTTPVFEENEIYDFFSLNLLENNKILDGVCDF